MAGMESVLFLEIGIKQTILHRESHFFLCLAIDAFWLEFSTIFFGLLQLVRLHLSRKNLSIDGGGDVNIKCSSIIV